MTSIIRKNMDEIRQILLVYGFVEIAGVLTAEALAAPVEAINERKPNIRIILFDALFNRYNSFIAPSTERGLFQVGDKSLWTAPTDEKITSCFLTIQYFLSDYFQAKKGLVASGAISGLWLPSDNAIIMGTAPLGDITSCIGTLIELIDIVQTSASSRSIGLLDEIAVSYRSSLFASTLAPLDIVLFQVKDAIQHISSRNWLSADLTQLIQQLTSLSNECLAKLEDRNGSIFLQKSALGIRTQGHDLSVALQRLFESAREFLQMYEHDFAPWKFPQSRNNSELGSVSSTTLERAQQVSTLLNHIRSLENLPQTLVDLSSSQDHLLSLDQDVSLVDKINKLQETRDLLDQARVSVLS